LEQIPVRLVIFTRFPAAGKAKTRLIPAIGALGASAVHRTLTERTVARLKSCKGNIEICYTGAGHQAFADWLGDDLIFVPQPEGDLTDRLLAALDPAPVIFFGSDTPDLQDHHVNDAIAALYDHDVVIGPAEDGGYYLVGVNASYQFLFENMAWSTDRVLPETLKRATANKLKVKMLEMLSDCDRPEDLKRWPWLTV